MSGESRIQPIVLVGGSSRRFGRDKLREPLAGAPGEPPLWLVDVPRLVLRGVFGPPIACVGECAPEVAARFDLVIPDSYPGVGPIGGILSALVRTNTPVFVLAGDAIGITAEVVREMVTRANEYADAAAVLAHSSGREPCLGVYREAAVPFLRARLETGSSRLFDAIPDTAVMWVPVGAEACQSVNCVADLDQDKSGKDDTRY